MKLRKRKASELELLDLAVDQLSPRILDVLKMAAVTRPRRKMYDPLAKKVADLGYPPSADTWRGVARRFLRRWLPGAMIYVGGHHVAVHNFSAEAPGNFGRCVARIAEVAA